MWKTFTRTCLWGRESDFAGWLAPWALAAALMLNCSSIAMAQRGCGAAARFWWQGERTLGPPLTRRNPLTAAEGWKACGKGATTHPAADALPDAPEPQASAHPAPAPGSPSGDPGVIAFLPPPISRTRLTPKDKLQIYAHQNYGPQNFIFPAIQAGFYMAFPPPRMPREWVDGGGAFGRWYGQQIVASTANRTGRLLTQLALHEDPRYVPSTSKNTLVRTLHALAFTIVDKTDSGHNTFAFSNLAGAAAGGFVGMGIFPDGYNDVSHAERRALRGLETIAIRNIATEFRPEWAPVLRKLHVPVFLPEWWSPKQPRHP